MARVRASGLLSIDTTSATASLDALIAKFMVTNRAVTDFSNVVGVFNDTGKLVSASFQAAIANGTKFGVTINDVNGRMVAHNTSAIKTKDAINQLSTAYKDAIAQKMDKAFQLNTGTSVENMEKLRRTFNEFFAGLRGGREQVGFFNQALNALTTGQGVGALTGQAEKYYRKLFDIRTELNAINEETTKSLAKAAPKVITPQQRADIAKELQSSFGAIPRGTPEEIENLKRKFIDLLNVLGTGPDVVNRLQRGIQELSVKNLARLSPELAGIRRELADYFKALEGVGVAAQKAKDAAAKVKLTTLTPGQENIVSKRLSLAFGPFGKGALPIGSSEKELENLERKTVDVQRELAKLGSKDAFANLAEGLKSINDYTYKLPLVLQTLREKLVNLDMAYRELGTEAQKSADAQLAAQNKVAKKTKADNDAAALKARRQQEARTAGLMVQTAFPDLFKNVEGRQLEVLRVRLGRVVSDVAKGKISLLEFATAIDVVQKAGVKGAKIDIQAPNVEETISKIQRMNSTIPEVKQKMVTAGQAISNSWQSVVSGFNSVMTAFRNVDRISDFFTNAAKSAAEFSQSIALIRTLAQDSSDSTEDWANAVKDLSVQLGLTSADVAAGAYEGLSNQIINNVEQLRQMGLAIGKLAVITGGTFRDSIDTVSGVLNSFQLEASRTQEITEQLFATIDLGKVKMNDLKDSIGRVGPFASSLSLKTEELFGMLASLTRQGITSSVAMTEIGQAMNALAKPSEGLQRILDRMGFPTARQAIDAMGYLNFVKEIQRVTAGAPEELAKHFQELRGQKAWQGITGDFLPDFEADIKKIKDSSNVTAEAIKEVFKNPGQEFRQELEKINRFFLEEWNTRVLVGIVEGGKAFGGFSNAVEGAYKSIANFGLPLITGAAALKTLSGAIALFTADVGLATTALAAFNALSAGWTMGIGAVVIGSAASFQIITKILDEWDNSKIKVFNDLMALAAENTKVLVDRFKRLQEMNAKPYLDAVERLRKAELTGLAKVRSGINLNKENIIKQGVDIAEAIKDTFKRVSLTAEREISNLQRAAENSLKNAKQAIDFIGDAKLGAAASLFERNIARIERRKPQEFETEDQSNYQKEVDIVNLAKQRLQILGQQRTALERSTDPDKVQKVNDLFDEQQAIMESIAGRSREVTDEYTGQSHTIDAVVGVEREILMLNEARAVSMKQLSEEQKQQAVVAQQAADAKKKELDLAAEAFRAVAEFSIFDKKGAVLPEFDPKSEGSLERAKVKLEALQETARKAIVPVVLTISDKLTVETSFAQKNKEIAEVFTKQLENAARGIDVTKELEDTNQVEKDINDTAAERVRQEKQLSDVILQNRAIRVKELLDAKALAEALAKNTLTPLKIPFAGRGIFEDPYEGIRDSIVQLGKDAAAAVNDTSKLDAVLKRAEDLSGFSEAALPRGTIVDPKTGMNVEQALAGIIESIKSGKEALEVETRNQVRINTLISDEEISRLNDKAAQVENTVKGLANIEPATAAFTQLTAATDPVERAIIEIGITLRDTANGFTSGITPAVNAMETLRQKAIQTRLEMQFTPTVTTPFVGPPKSEGGLLKFFAAGGYARGIDRNMIMAANGEFIVNPASTRRFLPQLVQLNRGQAPTFNNRTSNTNVGDINITITGYEGPKQTVREIGAQLRREIRRGTIKF